jgi:hypothetical protein
MSQLGDARDLDFSTTNGSVVVEMPDDLGAEVTMSTTNGTVSTEFPATVQGRIDPRRMTIRLGDGSRRVRCAPPTATSSCGAGGAASRARGRAAG